jgi:flavin-dependent dehydrogenase
MQAGMNDGKTSYDIVVIGNGLAGTAASVHLSRAGMRVVERTRTADGTAHCRECRDL